MTDLASIERYAIAVPLRVAAGLLTTNPTALRRRLARGTLSGVKLGDQWFLRQEDVTAFAEAHRREVGGEAPDFLRRWSPVDTRSLPSTLDLAEVELLLAERRILLYRLLMAGSLEGVRGRDGWTVPRDALLAALALPAVAHPREHAHRPEPSSPARRWRSGTRRSGRTETR
ncbi:UNVERIFIED_CONTAM: hypothetical protein OHV15_06990 [Microbacterium sp. SLM126]